MPRRELQNGVFSSSVVAPCGFGFAPPAQHASKQPRVSRKAVCNTSRMHFGAFHAVKASPVGAQSTFNTGLSGWYCTLYKTQEQISCSLDQNNKRYTPHTARNYDTVDAFHCSCQCRCLRVLLEVREELAAAEKTHEFAGLQTKWHGGRECDHGGGYG